MDTSVSIVSVPQVKNPLLSTVLPAGSGLARESWGGVQVPAAQISSDDTRTEKSLPFISDHFSL